jgi:ectoine hydroxylase-related dioxygenase (phytanoyl-CoA dioxygenase family)
MAKLNTYPATASADEVVAGIEEQSYAIVHGALDARGLAAIRGDLAPYLAVAPAGNESLTGYRTRRFGSLLAKVPFVREMVMHPLVLAVAEKLLGPSCARFQLNYTGIMHVEPGETPQTLHRDTGFYPFQNPCPPLILASMWAVSDFTIENGATCLVPGSHAWPEKRKPEPHEIVAAEMPAGSVLLYDGATFHGAGSNRSDAPRTGCALHYTLGWLRQEENQYMAVPPELARTFPRPLQELMGYALAAPSLGFVDRRDPNEVLNGTAGEGPGDLRSDKLIAAGNAIKRFRVTDTEAVGLALHDVAAPFSQAN